MNIIKNLLIVIISLFSNAAINSMTNLPFDFVKLPKEMQDEILLQYVDSVVRGLSQEIEKIRKKEELELIQALEQDPDFDPYEITKKNKERRADILAKALKEVRNLAATSQELNRKMNEPRFTYRLIVHLAELFDANDETVAKALGTKAAQDRIQLQKEFLNQVGILTGIQFSQRKFDDFIKRGVDLEWTDEFGWTPLFNAVTSYKLAATKALIKAGVDVNYKNNEGQTALGLAIRPRGASGIKTPVSQIVEIIKFLVDSGADLFATQELSGITYPQFATDLKKEVIDAVKQAQLNLRNYVRYVQPKPRKRVVNLKFIE